MIEYINTSTYKYTYTYRFDLAKLDKRYEYILFSQICKQLDKTSKQYYAKMGIIDPITMDLYECPVKLDYIYVLSALGNKSNENCPECSTYNFVFMIYNSEFNNKRKLHFCGSVHEFIGCCQLLNYYVNSGFDINKINEEKLSNRYSFRANSFGIESYTMLDISKKIKYSDFLDFLQNAKVKSYSSCHYNIRRGEYAHGYWEIITFSSTNIVFVQLLCSLYGKEITNNDGLFKVEMRFDEEVDYNGGLSVMIEDEGVFETDSHSHFKEDLIKDIVNKTHKDFPSELDIMCRLIAVD